VNVDVDIRSTQLDEKHGDRKAVAGEHVGIGGAQRTREQRVAQRPAVDKHELLQGVGAVERRQSRVAGKSDVFALRPDRHGVFEERMAEHMRRAHAMRIIACVRLEIEGQPIRAGKREPDMRMGQSEAPHDLRDRARLGAVGA
jgi:hypothetical protein